MNYKTCSPCFWRAHTPIAEVLIARIRLDKTSFHHNPQSSVAAVYFSDDEDPGPCRVALATLYSLEERSAGKSRIRNLGLHVKMISLGAKQISDLNLDDTRMDILYLVSLWSKDLENSVKQLGLSVNTVEDLKCSLEDLESVSLPRAQFLKI